MISATNVDQYISGFSDDTQTKLIQLRQLIKETAPQAVEVISYGMPGYKLEGMLVWFAAAKNHIGLYPKANVLEVFKDELTSFKCSKGTVQFPLSAPLPVDLIKKIVQFRVEENHLSTKSKVNKKTAIR